MMSTCQNCPCKGKRVQFMGSPEAPQRSIQIFQAAIREAPTLPHTSDLPGRYKPCWAEYCVECLAYDLQTYIQKDLAFIAPSLSFRLITDFALRICQPLLNHHIQTAEEFNDRVVQIRTNVDQLPNFPFHLKLRIANTAIAMLQWYVIHFLLMSDRAACVLPRLHWTNPLSECPQIDWFRTGRMIAYNKALIAERRYPTMVVYAAHHLEDMNVRSSLWAAIGYQLQCVWSKSHLWLLALRHIIKHKSGFAIGEFPEVRKLAEGECDTDCEELQFET